ncbi:hypothetical protein MRX96_052176 [Rhipicephalus microplus]
MRRRRPGWLHGVGSSGDWELCSARNELCMRRCLSDPNRFGEQVPHGVRMLACRCLFFFFERVDDGDELGVWVGSPLLPRGAEVGGPPSCRKRDQQRLQEFYSNESKECVNCGAISTPPVAARLHGTLPVQRVRPLLQDERRQQAAHEATQANDASRIRHRCSLQDICETVEMAKVDHCARSQKMAGCGQLLKNL